MKKILLKAFFLMGIISAGTCAFALEFSVKALPAFNFPLNSQLNTTLNVNLAFDVDFLNLRGRDSLYGSFQGAVYPQKASRIDPFSLYEGQFSLGYEFRIIDRVSVGAEGGAGLWLIPKDKDRGWEKNNIGYLYGGRGYVNLHVLPELTASLFGGYKCYTFANSPYDSKVELGIGVRYNLNQGLFKKAAVKPAEEGISVDPLFPVFYSLYTDHSFGHVNLVNNEKTDITDVKVYFYMEKFMSNPYECASFDRVKRGEDFSADLTAFLNEAILNNILPSRAEAKIIVEYKCLGKPEKSESLVVMDVYGRNSMTWEDDRHAAAFVSSHDASAMLFARRTKSALKSYLNTSEPENIQYARALFKVLKAYGLNYVVDPSSAFTDNVGSASVDFLQYPYQTLLYHGGDCDDLSILNCALLEAIGIQTAFITVPGHIFIAFDSGVPVEKAASVGQHIIYNGKVWIPLEITLCQDTFEMERNIGAHEWNKFPNERAIIPLRQAWEQFPAVGIPESDVSLNLPNIETIVR